MTVSQLLSGALLLLLSATVGSAGPELSNMDIDGMLAYHAELAQVLREKEFAHISMRDRQEIDRAQSLIRSRLEGYKSMSELTEAGRVDVFNAHEHVVALVDEAEDERMQCNRRKIAGSHTMQVVCEKASDADRSRRKLALEEIYRKNINRPAGS